MNLNPHGKARASEPALEGVRVFIAVLVAQLLTYAPGTQAQIQISSRPLPVRRNICEYKADGLNEGNCKVATSTYTRKSQICGAFALIFPATAPAGPKREPG